VTPPDEILPSRVSLTPPDVGVAVERLDALVVAVPVDLEPLARWCVELTLDALTERERLRGELELWKAVADERAASLARADQALAVVARAVESAAVVAESATVVARTAGTGRWGLPQVAARGVSTRTPPAASRWRPAR